MSHNHLTIREATPADVPQILTFIHGLAHFEREPDSVHSTEADILRDGFGPTPLFHCLIADYDHTPAGFALHFPIYSTWTGAGIHLEDLFVLPEFRGRGIGKALITRVAAIAQARGCQRLQWNVLDWNATAIAFYESLGAFPLSAWRIMRLTGEALPALAAKALPL